MSGTHDGHRQRVRKQFLKDGFPDSTPYHKILETLLFYAIPRKDTNELAHKLIDTFGSFAGVFDASAEDLMRVGGVSENTACLIKMILPIARHYDKDLFENRLYLPLRSQAAEFLAKRFIGRTVETVFILCLDNKGKVLDCNMVSEGDEVSVAISARTVVEQVFKTHATAVMIAHNHPRGVALPSKQDVKVTRDISTALENLGIRFLDHIIVSEGDYISMADSREYELMFSK